MALLERLVLALELDANGAVANARRFESEVGRALSPVEKLQQQLKLGFNVGLGAAGAGSVVDLAKQAALGLAQVSVASVKAAAEDQRSQIVLAGVLRNTADARSSDIQAAERQIDTLSRLTGVADDALRPAFATLARTTQDTTKASELLTVALDTATGTGADVTSVADALAKAFNGNAKALRSLTPELSNLIKEGASADEIVARLRDSFGGLSTSAADPFARLSVASNEAKEALGRGLLPVVSQVADGADAAAPAVEQVAQNIALSIAVAQQGAVALGGYAKALLELDPRAKQAAQSIQALFGGSSQGTVLSSAVRFRENIERTRAAIDTNLQALNAAQDGYRNFSVEVFNAANSADVFNQILGSIPNLLGAQASFDSALTSLADVQSSSAAAAKQRAVSEFEVESAARSVKQAEEDLTEAERNLAEVRRGASADEKKRAEQEVANAAQRSRVANVRLAEAENNLARVNSRPGTSQADKTRAQLDYEQALLDVQNATSGAEDAQKSKNETDNRGKEGSKELADAIKRVEDAQWSVKSAYESQRRLFEQDANDGGPAGRAAAKQTSGFLAARDAAKSIIQAMIETKAPIDEVIAKAEELRDKNIEAGKAAGIPQSAIDQVNAYYDVLIATAKYQDYLNRWARDPGGDPDGYEGIYLKGLLDSSRDKLNRVGQRAMGGGVNVGEWYQINESRKEYFKPNGSGTVVPLFNGGGMGGVNHFNFAGAIVATDADLERLVLDVLERAKRRGWN